MTSEHRSTLPRLTVVGAGDGAEGASGGWSLVADGTVPIGVGGALAAGFGVEAAKSFFADEPAGRWWYVAAYLVGVALIIGGLWLRTQARRRVRVGVVVTAADPRRGRARSDQLTQQAESFSQRTCSVTLRTTVDLPEQEVGDRAMVDALADETLSAIALAERLTPDAAQVNLLPTMPLHVAFWFGARLGHTHARDVVVHAIRQADGSPTHFPATSLRVPASPPTVEPLVVGRLEAIDGADPSRVAIALDLQGRGDQFVDQVTATCRERGIGYLLPLRNSTGRLVENRATFDGAVEQTCRALRDAALTQAARTGRAAIFLSGPVAIAVALGARLAAPETGRWTAYTWDSASNVYEPFPPPP